MMLPSRTLLCIVLAAATALCVHIEAIPIEAGLNPTGLLATDWKICGQGEWKLQNVTLGPQHITPGTQARFVINAVSGNDVEAGHITMLVRLQGLPIYTQQDDLCSKTSCPIESGAEAKIAYEQDFPVYTPPAEYSVTLSGQSAEGAALFCVEITFEVEPPSSTPFDDVLHSLSRQRRRAIS